MKVFVTGGTGAVGGHAVTALVRAGHTVTGLARTPASAALLAARGGFRCSTPPGWRSGSTGTTRW
ncbi:NAD-dependent epimerase/dehydratase family protein [Amycolatopsis sp. FDAARGOS 1241]|uniref:NAD-dependent epimerase/dehydratase family protein n=1 Tax=Amycolatopsis sp. FDAARGOS 1241 TaxID=2778070 RepID=UPI00194E8784|nr:NAD-dependent epimerase/dehydratase family protein [Amycolatopsis sp. FDAARGOS 1241]